MHGRQLLLPITAALLAVPVVAGTPGRRAAILPEVQKHMDQGYSAMPGNAAEARAHAELVLVGEEVSYATVYQGVRSSERKRSLEALVGAMREWESVLDGSVRFVPVASPARANIQVRFRPGVQINGEDVAGYVNWKRTITADPGRPVSWQYKADMQVRTVNVDDEAMPSAAMRHAAMHELGHVLGLDDSERQGDVMGPLDVTRPAAAPQPYEIAAVRELRQQALQLRDDAMALTARK